MNKHKKNLTIILTTLVVLTSIFLPGTLLKYKENRILNNVMIDDNSYYYAGVEDMDIKLYERLKLVSNQLEIKVSEIDIHSSDKKFLEIVDIVEKILKICMI